VLRVKYAVSVFSLTVLLGGVNQLAYAQEQATPATPSNGSDQSGTPAQNATPTPPPRNAFSTSAVRLGGIDFSAMVDGYYTFNNNHPISQFDAFYNFDDRANQVDLNLLKLTASRDPAPIGFRFDVGFGRMFQLIHVPPADPDGFKFVEQAYISIKPKKWKGFEADFGQFVTSAGAEVIEAKDNWNYSRSLLFALANPYFHFGVRTTMPIGSSVTVGVQVVNGWNVVVDRHGNNMQTVGLTGSITRKKFTWSHNYYVGPQYTAVTQGNRNLYDTVLLLTPQSKVSAYVQFDYGQQHALLSGLNHWIGVAGAARWQINKHFAASSRLEYYNDSTGFTTGTAQKLHEVTVTGEYKPVDGFLARAEYRHDGSNVPYFDHGNESGVSKTQSTVTIALIAYFPVKH
jgi:Putative beta-barrel porin-2, OmpL-like. bbp2